MNSLPLVPRSSFDHTLVEFARRPDIQKRLALSAAAGTPEIIVFRTGSNTKDAAEPRMVLQKDVRTTLGVPEVFFEGHDAPEVTLAIHLHDDEISYCWIGRD